MPSLFDSLVTRYKSLDIAFPALKPVTVAQWILESGRGSSRLATEHLNFGGLKWRSEMIGFATPVDFEAHDGLDFYCKFASLDAFIVGYWRFLARSPYEGWEEHAEHGAEAFFHFIGPIYNPSGDAYVRQVLALTAEATQRLASAPAVPAADATPIVAGTPVMIVIDPGHGGSAVIGGSSPNNAKAPNGEVEKNWTLDFAKRTRNAVLGKALTLGKNVTVVLTRETDVNVGLSARANVARNKRAKLFLSIHFNGFDGHARGVETLIHKTNVNKADDHAFAQVVQDKLLAAMKDIDPGAKGRGVKEQSLGALSDVALGNTLASHPCRACMVEVEFMDTVAVSDFFSLNPGSPAVASKTASNRQHIADALADALLSQV